MMSDETNAAAPAPSDRFPLKYPFEFGGKTITELRLRRPKGKDIGAMEAAQRNGGNSTVTMALLASFNDLPIEAIGEIDAEDLVEVSERVVGFLPLKMLQKIGAE